MTHERARLLPKHHRRQGAAHQPRSRTIGYKYTGTFDEAAVNQLLARAKAKGLVVQYDADHGDVWFSGPPGAPLRGVRTRVLALIADPHPW